MIEDLIVFGDSNSYGCETVADGDFQNPKNPNFAYGKYVQESLGLKTYKNFAIPGASNIMILETLLTHLPFIDKEKTLILLGWSETNRLMFNVKDHEYRISECLIKKLILHSRIKSSTMNADHRQLIEPLINQPFMQEFVKGILLYYFTSDYFHLNDDALRLCADNVLFNGKYKFLAFSTLGDAEHRRVGKIKDLFSSNTMFNFHYRGFAKYGSSSSQGHLKTEAHKKVAETLIEELKKRNII